MALRHDGYARLHVVQRGFRGTIEQTAAVMRIAVRLRGYSDYQRLDAGLSKLRIPSFDVKTDRSAAPMFSALSAALGRVQKRVVS